MALNFLPSWFGKKSEVPQKHIYGIVELGCDKSILPKDFLSWYKNNPFVFNAIEERAKACANAKFFIKTDEGDLLETELTKQLSNPQHIKRDITYMSIFGTSYMYANKLRKSKDIDETDILILDTEKVYFPKIEDIDFIYEALKFNEINQQIFYVSDNKKVVLNKDLLLPFFDTATFSNPYYSESRLESMQLIVSNIQSALESQNTFLSNPSGIGAWVSKMKDSAGSISLSPDEKEEAEKSLSRNYGSLKGQRPVRIIGSQMDYISTLPKIADLQLNETLVKMGLILFGAYDLPSEAFTALSEGATFENQTAAYRGFIQSACQVIMDTRAHEFNKRFPQSNGEIVASFEHMPIMQENEEERSRVNNIEIDALTKKKAMWDDWLTKGYITEKDYKNEFGL